MPYTRRKFISTMNTIGFGLAGLAIKDMCWANTGAADRPNILFIMADDHTSHSLSAYGSTLNKTPNIDRLAQEGVRFTNCFNVISMCAPSRASLISGRYNHHNGLLRNGDNFDGAQATFPKMLRKAGYQTALIGKWHLRSKPTGFDHYSVIPGHGKFFDCPFRDTGKPWGQGTVVKGYLTEVITDKAINWMEKRDASKPFCLMVHHKAPHTPYHYTERYEKLYADSELPKPDNFDADYKNRGSALAESRGRWSKLKNLLPAHFNKKVPQGVKRGTTEYKEWAYQCVFKGYLRLVASLDDNVGRLLEYIDASGLAENTVVVYTSDNGFFLGEYGLFNKMWMYEESLRIPLLLRYPPSIKPGTVKDDLVSILDFAPTFLDYAQASPSEQLQGESIRPILEGNTPSDWRKAHYYHYYGQYDVPAHRGVRTQRFKLIHYYNKRSWELYDMINDPRELRNIYNRPEQKQTVERLKNLLNDLQIKYEGPIDSDLEGKPVPAK